MQNTYLEALTAFQVAYLKEKYGEMFKSEEVMNYAKRYVGEELLKHMLSAEERMPLPLFR